MTTIRTFFSKSSLQRFVLCVCLILCAFQFAACSSREQRAQRYYESGMSYLEKKDYAKARIELRNALQLREDMVDAWRALAKIDEHDRNAQSLLASLRRIAELDDKDVSIGAFFDWLIGICENAEDKSLLEKSLNFKEYMMNQRELAQRFSL